MRAWKNSGFSIIEIALAMLVVGVGLMGVFALFPVGTDANRKAIQETQVGLFAEYVLNGFRYEASQIPWHQVADAPSFSIPSLGGQYAWESPPQISAGSGIKLASYKVLARPEIEEMGFRYEFRVVGQLAGRSTNVKAYILYVWPGAFMAPAGTNASVFYTEVFNYGSF